MASFILGKLFKQYLFNLLVYTAFKDSCNMFIQQFSAEAWHQTEVECGYNVLPYTFACITKCREILMPSVEMYTFLAILPTATQAQSI